MPGTFDGRLAFASILFTAPGAPAFRTQSGDFASVAVVGGVTRLTFQDPIAPYQGFPSLTLRSATGGYASVVDWTSTYLDIETLDTTGAAAEIEFDLTIVQQTVAFVVPPPGPPPPPPPPPVANLIGHWDASSLVGIPPGGVVTLWPDLSGTGNDLNTNGGFGGVDPIYVASDPLLNSLPAVSFNGTQWILRGGPPVGLPAGDSPVTIYTVAYSTLSANRPIWYWGNNTAGNQGGCAGFNIIAGPDAVQVNNNAASWGALAQPTNVPFVAAWAHTLGNNVDSDPMYLDGSTGASVVPSASAALNINPTTIAFALPGAAFSTFCFVGSIAEVLVYSATHSPATIAQVTAYLKNKWGIP